MGLACETKCGGTGESLALEATVFRTLVSKPHPSLPRVDVVRIEGFKK